jgi:sec-independent protein translocase protein TatA
VQADVETVRVCLGAFRTLQAGIPIFKLLILLLIVLLLFSSRLPSAARAVGQSILEFKKGIKELESHSDDDSSA